MKATTTFTLLLFVGFVFALSPALLAVTISHNATTVFDENFQNQVLGETLVTDNISPDGNFEEWITKVVGTGQVNSLGEVMGTNVVGHIQATDLPADQAEGRADFFDDVTSGTLTVEFDGYIPSSVPATNVVQTQVRFEEADEGVPGSDDDIAFQLRWNTMDNHLYWRPAAGGNVDTGVTFLRDTWQTYQFDYNFNGANPDSVVVAVDGNSSGALGTIIEDPTIDFVMFRVAQDGGELFFDRVGEPQFAPSLPTSFSWAVDDSGNWGDADNWTLGGPPDSGGHTAIFGNAIDSPQTVFTNAAVTVNSIQFENAFGYAVAGQGSVNLADDGGGGLPSVSVAQGEHQFQAIVNLAANTSVDVAGGSTLIFNNALNLAGNNLTKTGTGEMAIRNDLVTGGGTINIQEGTVSGNGTVGGNVNNQGGTISPGNSPGVIAVEGDFAQGEQGTLHMELAGNVAGSQYDQFIVAGEASLAGTLEVSLLDGFEPQAGDTFDILQFGALSGDFGRILLPSLGGALAWDESALLINGSLSVVPEPSVWVILLAGLVSCSFSAARSRRQCRSI